MNELDEAIALAHRLLDEPRCDPDDDLRVLSRQLLREVNGANEGPIVNGLVQLDDGVLPPFYKLWKCSQCGRDPEDVRHNGCGYSLKCGRVLASS